MAGKFVAKRLGDVVETDTCRGCRKGDAHAVIAKLKLYKRGVPSSYGKCPLLFIILIFFIRNQILMYITAKDL